MRAQQRRVRKAARARRRTGQRARPRRTGPRARRPAAAAPPRRRSTDRLKLVLDVSSLLASSDMRSLLARIAEAASALLDAERASVFLHDPAAGELWTLDELGGGEIRLPAAAGVVGHVFHTGEVIYLPDPLRDGRFGPEALRRGSAARSMLCAPMRDIDRQAIGVVEVVNKRKGVFTAEDSLLLQLLAEHAAIAVRRYRLLLEASLGVELRREMELARQVQCALIPQNPPRIEGLAAVGWTRPASITGGDCYDIWRLPDGRLGVFLGDASGHGLAAALVIAQVRTLLRALSDIQSDPQWLLSRVNARLAGDLDEGRFATAFFGCLSSDGWLKWSSAGQGPIFVRRARGERVHLLAASAVPLAVSADLIADPSAPLQLEGGGTLVVLSDGLIEARNAAGEMFGAARVAQLLDETAEEDPRALMARLREEVQAWQGGEEPADDQTVVVVGREA